LPALSAQQILADVVAAKPPQLTGSLEWTANLGFSGLSALEQEAGQGGSGGSGGGGGGAGDGSFDPLNLLSGNYQLNVWLDGEVAEHVALIDGPAEEVDLVRNGNQGWLWDSSTETAEHLIWDQGTSAGSGQAGAGWSGGIPPTPAQLATRLLQNVGETTSVTTGAPLYVAGEPAYQLLVSPKSAGGSTVDHVEIDVGATGSLLGVPLQVAVYAVGQSSPAIEIGFTGAVHVGPPPTSELSFTPPPGAKVTTHTFANASGAGDQSATPPATPLTTTVASRHLTTTGTGWTTVVSGLAPELVSSTDQGLLSEASTVVQVNGQTARLFSAVLVNILLMPDGRFFAGFVTPSVLEAAASTSS
jgi:hypothetical protein